jgi:hypothetical protein
MINFRYILLYAILIIFILEGCGSGDGTLDNDPNPPSTNTDNVNQGLTGYLYSSESLSDRDRTIRYPVIIDVATGRSHRILEPLELDSTLTAPFPSADGRTLIMTGDNQSCNDFQDGVGLCLFLAQLGQSPKLLYPFETYSPARISPNGEMLVVYSNLGSISTAALRLISLDGELIEWVGDRHIGSYTWLPDGRLMYVWDKIFYLTDAPYDLDATSVYTFTGDEDIRFLSPSHDGTRIAFQVYDTRYSYVMVMNVDGSGLRQLTDNDPDDISSSRQGHPVWSPDGQWIMVQNDSKWEPTLYAVRSDAIRVILHNDQYAEGDAIKIQTDWQDHLTDKGTGNILTAWLSDAPFLNLSPKAHEDSSVSSNLSGE